MPLVLDPENNMFHWNRGEIVPLSEHFSTQEFTCQCGKCEAQTISAVLVERLEALRNDVMLPLLIRSGYRCRAHQLALAESGLPTAKGTSTHELGEAADIAVKGMAGHRVASRAAVYFNAIGTAKTWIHVDLRSNKIRRWSYP